MKYAVVDVFYDVSSHKIRRIRYDNIGNGYVLSDACDLMRDLIMRDLIGENPDTHYPYLEYMY